MSEGSDAPGEGGGSMADAEIQRARELTNLNGMEIPENGISCASGNACQN